MTLVSKSLVSSLYSIKESTISFLIDLKSALELKFGTKRANLKVLIVGSLVIFIVGNT